MPKAALDNWQSVWNAQVPISTPVCVNFDTDLDILVADLYTGEVEILRNGAE